MASTEEYKTIVDGKSCFPLCFINEKEELKIENVTIQIGEYDVSCCDDKKLYRKNNYVVCVSTNDTVYVMSNGFIFGMLSDDALESDFYDLDYIHNSGFNKINLLIKDLSIILSKIDSKNKEAIINNLVRLFFPRKLVGSICPSSGLYGIKASYGDLMDSLPVPEALYLRPRCITLVPDQRDLYYLIFYWDDEKSILDFYYLNNPKLDYNLVYW